MGFPTLVFEMEALSNYPAFSHRITVSWIYQDGLYFLQLMKWGILQYCALRPLWAIITHKYTHYHLTVFQDHLNCHNPRLCRFILWIFLGVGMGSHLRKSLWCHFITFNLSLWQITIVVSLSVTIAMYCLVQLYVSVSKKLVKHKPLLKLFAIKAVGL
jgi:hypothetical protein